MRTRVVILGIVLALCATAAVLLTVAEGRERATLDGPIMLVSELGRGTVHLAQQPVVLTAQREREIGRESLAKIPIASDSSPESLYVMDVFGALITGLGRVEYDYEVHTVAWDEPNAFALPGGFLVVTHGLLKVIRHEAELAAVLGHEINHVHRGHWRDALKQQVVIEKAGLEDLGALTRMAYRVLEIGFSESQELEADRAGIELAARAGYAPRAAHLVFRRLEAIHPSTPEPAHRDPARLGIDLLIGSVRAYSRSHPPTAQRLENVEQTIRDHRREWGRSEFYWGRSNLEKRVSMAAGREEEESRPLDFCFPP